ncbi:YsnF/AvaK domain-containing protein [Arthrobacter sp. ov118]|uniref:YsnF/AvaK domain-containing protein n=1 Tax=Arthrobacter sp. ov118 TaxID=1761747 RepID=UPI0008E20019|nr:YsnF/AvaK domain-containing protein [Arthrobacter sp. ov118]SFT92489.1 conserved domain-containing protein [Arthrobacter sp. ov118]
MLAKEHIDDLLHRNGNILSSDGSKIGSIGQVYADDTTGQPTWVTAKTGLFGTSESFVPLEGARVEGNDLVVPYTKDQVKDAPRVDTDGHLEPSEEDRLYSHYSLGGGNRTYTDAAAGRDADSRGTDYADTDRGTVGRDTSGPTTDDAMTRSEERLNVGTERQATGRVRLRKYVTTENVTQTVPVQREEVRIEREPITDANRGSAMSGPDLSDEEHEVTLHEERPVVEKETVPVERVRLDKETVTDDVTVNEEVRKERIETDDDDSTRR